MTEQRVGDKMPGFPDDIASQTPSSFSVEGVALLLKPPSLRFTKQGVSLIKLA